jgi:hypothetical protein
MKNETGWSLDIFCVSLHVFGGKWSGAEMVYSICHCDLRMMYVRTLAFPLMGSKDGILCFTSATASTQAHSSWGYNVANSRSLDDKLRYDMMKMKRFYIFWSAQLSMTLHLSTMS